VIAQALVVRKSSPRSLAAAVLLSALAAGVALPLQSAQAQDAVADFYKGKQMKFVIRSAGGGGYDLYSRLIAFNIVKHIPGNPSMLPQNMPGAGGITAANYVATIAPHDGTVLTMISQALPMDQSLGFTPTFTADLRTFGWIGNLGDSNVLTYTWHTSPVKTMEDAKKYETTIGATGAGSATSWLPAVYNTVLGTKFKIINGYKSGSEVKLAMDRGEVQGYAANPWAALMSASPDLVRDHKISILVQVGTKRERDLPDVPLLSELANDPEGKAVLEFICKAFAVGRPIGTSPGVPPERLAALRKAFDDTLVDPVFLAEAAKAGAELKPMNGADMQTLINDVMSAPDDIKKKVKAVLPDRSGSSD
jgi:tripartite-type tricarboxylate transporter receptor subunit TctC